MVGGGNHLYIERVRAWQFPGLFGYVSADVPGWLARNINFREIRDTATGAVQIVGVGLSGSVNSVLEAESSDWFVGYPDGRLTLVRSAEFTASYESVSGKPFAG